MSMINLFETNLLKHYFNNDDHPLVGDASGLQNSAVAGSFHVSLHTAWPGETAEQNTSESAYTSYARQAVARSAAGWTVSGNNVSNAAAINFPQCTGGSETVFYFGIGSDSSGSAGEMFFWGILGTNLGPFAVHDPATNDVSIPAHGLSVDDRVAFFAEASELALPTGVTEGTVYFVKTVTDSDHVILSTTSGGAAVDITAVGRGVAFKMVGLAISNGIAPKFNIGELDVFGY